ncbi:hypothetical protein HDU83_004790 [Entophlyctis luteolus]|nr:hypothetical protein HDU83_004790 [Entophlyctis luteolus]KAJ3382898.1 hypothetical protein HDU84_003963 [Entophlyctis sp. JEL0112]
MNLHDWWTSVSDTVLSPSSIIAVFAGENSKGTLRQACLRHKTVWCDIGVHPGQLSLAGHLLRCVWTPWGGLSTASNVLVAGVNRQQYDVYNYADNAPLKVTGYVGSILMGKLIAFRTKRLLESSQSGSSYDSAGTRTSVIHLDLTSVKELPQAHPRLIYSDAHPRLIYSDGWLVSYQILTSTTNLALLVNSAITGDISGILISVLFIIARLLVSATIFRIIYKGQQDKASKHAYKGVIVYSHSGDGDRIVIITGEYQTLQRCVIGKDDFEDMNERVSDAIIAVCAIMLSLAAVSYLLLFQYMATVNQLICLVSTIFGWCCDNRLNVKTEDSRIRVDGLPADSSITAYSHESRREAIAFEYLRTNDEYVREGLMRQLPPGSQWAGFRNQLQLAAKHKSYELVDQSVPFAENIANALRLINNGVKVPQILVTKL